jgi:ADP-ribose pyrophosphatase YjhB (NUDIX family)/GNAT superfamily N-acetyltransferase
MTNNRHSLIKIFNELKNKHGLNKDLLPGGKGDKAHDADFSKKEVAMGHKVEAEHTSNPKVAAEITRDHLTENPQYYSKLKSGGLADELNKGLRGDWQKEGYKLEHLNSPGQPGHRIVATDKEGNRVGSLPFFEHKNGVLKVSPGSMVFVDDAHRRKGLASAMYTYAEQKLGKKFQRGLTTPFGSKLWGQNDRPFGALEKASDDWKKQGYVIGHKADKSGKITVFAYHPANKGKMSGMTIFHPSDMRPAQVFVSPDDRRKGIATGMYQYAEKLTGKKMNPGETQTDMGKKLWGDPNRRFGKSKGLEKGLNGDWEKEGGYHFEIYPSPSGGVHIRAYHPSVMWGNNFVSESGNGEHSVSTSIMPDTFLEKYGRDFSVPYEDSRIRNNIPGKGGMVSSVTVDSSGQIHGSNTYPSHQRKGLATELYLKAQNFLGKPVKPDTAQSSDAKALWNQPNRPFGKSEDDTSYRIQHTAPTSDGGSPLHDLTNTFPADLYSPNGARYYGHGVPYDHKAMSVINSSKGNPSSKVRIYRAVPKTKTNAEQIAELESHKKHILKTGKMPKGAWPGFENRDKSDYYDFASNMIDSLKQRPEIEAPKMNINRGDWVSLTREYAKDHGEGVHGKGNFLILSKVVPASHVWSDGNSIHEWGYDPKPDVKKSEDSRKDPLEKVYMVGNSAFPERSDPDGTPHPTRDWYHVVTDQVTKKKAFALKPEHAKRADNELASAYSSFLKKNPQLTQEHKIMLHKLANHIAQDSGRHILSDSTHPQTGVKSIRSRHLASAFLGKPGYAISFNPDNSVNISAERHSKQKGALNPTSHWTFDGQLSYKEEQPTSIAGLRRSYGNDNEKMAKSVRRGEGSVASGELPRGSDAGSPGSRSGAFRAEGSKRLEKSSNDFRMGESGDVHVRFGTGKMRQLRDLIRSKGDVANARRLEQDHKINLNEYGVNHLKDKNGDLAAKDIQDHINRLDPKHYQYSISSYGSSEFGGPGEPDYGAILAHPDHALRLKELSDLYKEQTLPILDRIKRSAWSRKPADLADVFADDAYGEYERKKNLTLDELKRIPQKSAGDLQVIKAYEDAERSESEHLKRHMNIIAGHEKRFPTPPDNESDPDYDEYLDDAKSQQRHSIENSNVFQLNATPKHIQELKDAGVYDTYKALLSLTSEDHPVHPHKGIGWVRFTGDRKGIHIDEIQTDMGHNLAKMIQKDESGKTDHIKKNLNDIPKIQKILFEGKHPSEVLHEAFHQYLRDKGYAGAPVHIWQAKPKAEAAWMDTSELITPTSVKEYMRYPSFTGHGQETKKWVDANRQELDRRAKSIGYESAAQQMFIEQGGGGFGLKVPLPLPAHMTEGYNKIPKKMGYKPSKYGEIPTQREQEPTGQPTWAQKLAKARSKLAKSSPGQFFVDFDGVPKTREKKGLYATWELSKQDLKNILKNWDKHTWEYASASRPSASEKFHATARSRQSLSAPVSDYLKSKGATKGRVLYHGVGRDDVGADALNAEKYDPFHPNPEIRKQPSGKFDEVHSHYTLNVVDKDTGKGIIQHLHDLLNENGKAVISVRRDLPKTNPLAKSKGVDTHHDVPWVAGYSQDGSEIYIDKSVPKHMRLKGGRVINVHKYLEIHEDTEKTMIDDFGYDYDHAHEIALEAEKRAVELDGILWQEYDDFMQKFIRCSPGKHYEHVPGDLDLSPEIDDNDVQMINKIKGALGKSAQIPEVASVAIVNGDRILMGRRSDNQKFTLPGGHLNPDETPENGARRELFEEAGIKPNNLKYLGSERIACEDGITRLIHSFVAVGPHRTDSGRDPDKEVKTWQWVDCSKGLPQNIASNLHSKKNVTLKFLGLQKWNKM